jgi:hypothetical protein
VQAQTADPKHQPGTHTIFVNGREKIVEVNEISYEEVVELAFPNPSTGPDVRYTVTWARNEHGQADGKLLPGGTVKISETMIFNVERTDKS